MLNLLGPGDLSKQVCLGPKSLHYAKFWAQNATKTSAGNIPESLSNLFLRDNCRLLQRRLNNANVQLPCVQKMRRFAWILEKKPSVVLVICKDGFTKTILWTENPGKIRTGAFLVNPFLRFTKTTVFFVKFSVLKGQGFVLS